MELFADILSELDKKKDNIVELQDFGVNLTFSNTESSKFTLIIISLQSRLFERLPDSFSEISSQLVSLDRDFT